MAKGYHIIIADDDDDDQFIIKEALKEITSEEVSITSVYDGLQLMDCLHKKGLFAEHSGNPDLIILDINMPLMNGLEVLDTLKNNKDFRNIPVFMLSTLRTIDRVDRSLELGAINFYSKPNHISEYKTILREMLDKSIYSSDRMLA